MTNNLDKKRLLFIEGDQQILEQMRSAAVEREDRWECIFLNNPAEAAAHLESSLFDTVVLGIDITEPSAAELITHLRLSDNHVDVPVLVLSDRRRSAEINEVNEAGATEIVQRPIEPAAMTAHIEAAIELKTSRDKLHKTVMLAEQAEENYFDDSPHEVVEDGPTWGKLLTGGPAKYLYQVATNIEYHGRSPGRHVLRVAYISWEIAGKFNQILPRETGLTNRRKHFRENLFYAAMLHDIGLAEVPRELIERRSPLSVNEQTLLQHHCMVGAMMIREGDEIIQAIGNAFGSQRGSRILEMAARICLAHHENIDGSGYPLGNCFSGIPIEAGIVALADRFDALVYPHSHPRAQWTEEVNEFSVDYAQGELDLAVFPEALQNEKQTIFEQSLRALQQRAATEFNPIVFKAFEEIFPALSQTMSLLDNNRKTAGCTC